MEELFKSLSESVSEECYNEILDMVEELLSEDIISAIDKSDLPADKKEKLTRKARNIRSKERTEAINRDVENDPNYRGRSAIYGFAFPHGIESKHTDKVYKKRFSDKKVEGDAKTEERQFKGMNVQRPYGVLDPTEDDWKLRRSIGKKKAKQK